MKKIVNIFVILSILLLGYYYYGDKLLSSDEIMTVECTEEYSTELNLMDIDCTVSDPNSIISDTNSLTITLYDTEDVIVEEFDLVEGLNNITFSSLDYSTNLSIVVNGYENIDDVLTPKEFYTIDFSTVSEDFISPTVTTVLESLEDLQASFNIILTDEQETIVEIRVIVLEGTTEILNYIATDVDTTIQLLDSLNELTEYDINIEATYYINDLVTHTSILHSFSITTLKTPARPVAELTIVSNDNIDLVVSVNVSNEDAQNVIYSIKLIDADDNILYSESLTSFTTTIDISSIAIDYQIIITSDFLLEEINYTDITLDSYTINTNELSNFFNVPTLNLVDTSIPLTDYNDYDDYIYSHLNNGDLIFTINCDSSISCEVLMNTPVYFDLPFNIIGFTHPYFDSKSISYSYTSEKIDIEIHAVYTQTQIDEINIAVNDIINTITNELMTTEEKVRAAHDYVINTSYYDEECFIDEITCDNDHNAYGIFFDNNAVCEGYAHSMDILLRAMRIPTFRLSSETHQWNVVYVNGGWFHLDATWDDPVISGGGSLLLDDYFLITTSQLHTLDTSSTHTYDTTYSAFIN
jgi:hypothetical protein